MLVLSKPQALVVANSLTKKREYAERLAGSLQREQRLLELWQSTSDELAAQIQLTENLTEQIKQKNTAIEVTKKQLKLVEGSIKGSKRRSLFTGIGIGIVGGVVLTAVLTQ